MVCERNLTTIWAMPVGYVSDSLASSGLKVGPPSHAVTSLLVLRGGADLHPALDRATTGVDPDPSLYLVTRKMNLCSKHRRADRSGVVCQNSNPWYRPTVYSSLIGKTLKDPVNSLT